MSHERWNASNAAFKPPAAAQAAMFYVRLRQPGCMMAPCGRCRSLLACETSALGIGERIASTVTTSVLVRIATSAQRAHGWQNYWHGLLLPGTGH